MNENKHTVQTRLGEVQVVVWDGSLVIFAGSDQPTGPLTINGVSYRVRMDTKQDEDGDWMVGGMYANRDPHDYDRNYDGNQATPAARSKLISLVMSDVITWVETTDEGKRATLNAQEEHYRQQVARAIAKVSKLREELETAEAELAEIQGRG